MALKYDDNYVKTHSIYVAMLMANQDRIDWWGLSENPAAIELLTANQDKINWFKLSMNPATIELLAANQDRITWDRFCRTPFLAYDYDRIRYECASLNQAIITAVYHPARIQKWVDGGNEISDCMNRIVLPMGNVLVRDAAKMSPLKYKATTDILQNTVRKTYGIL